MPRFGKPSPSSSFSSSRLPDDPGFLKAKDQRSAHPATGRSSSDGATRRLSFVKGHERRVVSPSAASPRRSFEQSYMDSWASSEFLRQSRNLPSSESSSSIFYDRYQRNSYSDARMAPRYAKQIDLNNGRPLRPSLKGIPDPTAQARPMDRASRDAFEEPWPAVASKTTKIAPFYNPRRASKPIASRRRSQILDEGSRDDDRGERASARINASSSLQSKFHDSLRERRRHKADRAFAAYEGAQAAPADEGPRAAVTIGKMGSRQKKASRLHSSERPVSVPSSKISFAERIERLAQRPRVMAGLVVCCCLLASFLFIYPAAQDYYAAVRTNAQQQAEYEAILDRNDEIQDRIDVLQTDEGIEDKVRNELGWVKEGENAVSVGRQGSSDIGSDAQNQTAAITTGSVPAPDTWYSGFLDPFFGYSS